MRRQPRTYFRNRLDLTDHVQVRVVKRRLRLSEAELSGLVDRIGNSISAISKEVALRRAQRVSPPAEMPSAAIIDAAAKGEAETVEQDSATADQT